MNRGDESMSQDINATAETEFRFVTVAQRKVLSQEESENNATTSVSYSRQFAKKNFSERISTIWLIILCLIVLIAIFGGAIYGYDPNRINSELQNQAPSLSHLFGTDRLGRDIFVRASAGVRVSLMVAIVSTALSIVFGTIYGVTMAFIGGKTDAIMLRIIEIFNSIPSLLITMILMAILGNGVITMLFALAVTSWAGAARQTRGLVKQLKNLDYVTAAKMLNTPLWKITLKHFVPNMMSILILDIGRSIPDNIFAEASLSFLGLGLQPPNTSLGILISVGQEQMLQHPYQLYIPIVILILLVLAFNIVGDGIRDALDPRYSV
ncbi:ABC transporter permease [Weissella paramesenteroides]|nr:ABC transporter permease [Weissella paramesenteroides]MCS9999014.1 ABC transporter permease [Weissella paramesenteroides]MCT0260706.1 ABC transporter permease [Weissella paramesenteroides]